MVSSPEVCHGEEDRPSGVFSEGADAFVAPKIPDKNLRARMKPQRGFSQPEGATVLRCAVYSSCPSFVSALRNYHPLSQVILLKYVDFLSPNMEAQQA